MTSSGSTRRGRSKRGRVKKVAFFSFAAVSLFAFCCLGCCVGSTAREVERATDPASSAPTEDGGQQQKLKDSNLTAILEQIQGEILEHLDLEGQGFGLERKPVVEDVWVEGEAAAGQGEAAAAATAAVDIEGYGGGGGGDGNGNGTGGSLGSAEDDLLAGLSEQAKASIVGLNDHDVPDSKGDRLERMFAAFQELPEAERTRMGLDKVAAITDPLVRQAALEALWETRQKELIAAYEAMVKPADLLKDLIDVLKSSFEARQEVGSSDSSSTPSVSAVSEVLLTLEDHLGDVDMTRDFGTLGGWPLLVAHLGPGYPQELRKAAAWAVGTVVRNAPAYQEWLLEGPALGLLLQAVQEPSTTGSGLQAKAVYALSAGLQHNPPLQARFSTGGGVQALAKAMSGGDDVPAPSSSSSSNNSNSTGAVPTALALKILTLVSDLYTAAGASDASAELGRLRQALAEPQVAGVWCKGVHGMIVAEAEQAASSVSGSRLEKVLLAAQGLSPLCRGKGEEGGAAHSLERLGTGDVLGGLEKHFRQTSSIGDALDADYRKELISLLQDTKQVILPA